MVNDAVGKRIEKILTDIQSRKKVDYACRNDVSRYNRAYSRIVRKSCSLEEKKRAIAILEGLLEDERIDQVDKMMLSTNLVKWRAEVFGQ